MSDKCTVRCRYMGGSVVRWGAAPAPTIQLHSPTAACCDNLIAVVKGSGSVWLLLLVPCELLKDC